MKPREYCCCAVPLINAGIYATLTEQFAIAIVVGTLSVATPSSKHPAHPSCSPQSHSHRPSRRCCNSVVCPCPLSGFLLCSSSNPGSGLPRRRTSKWQAAHRVSLHLISTGKTNHVSQIRHSPHRCIYRSVCHCCCLDHHFCLSPLHRPLKLRGHFLQRQYLIRRRDAL